MQIDPELSRQAVEVAVQKYPSMAEYSARVIYRELFRGGAFLLEYDVQPPRDHPDAWEFQNAAVRAYQRLSGSK